MSNVADEILVAQIRDGEAQAFDALYSRYNRRLFSYIHRYVGDRDQAEDLLQEVFMKVLRDRSYDLRPGRFGGWLFTVARNACLTALRDARRRGDEQRRELEPAAVAEASPSPEAQLDVRAALASLPLPQQEALVLKQVAELTYRQIAEVLEVPEGTVKSRLHLAIRQLQQRMAAQT